MYDLILTLAEPTGLGLSFPRLLRPQLGCPSLVRPRVIHASGSATNQRFPLPPASMDLPEWLTELKEHFWWQFSKRRGRGYRWTGRWGHSRARPRRVPHAGAVSLRSWGTHPFSVDVFTNLEALQIPLYWDVSGDFLVWARGWGLGGQGWIFWAASGGWAFLVTSPHPGAHSQSPLEQNLLLGLPSLRELRGFRSPMPGTRCRDHSVCAPLRYTQSYTESPGCITNVSACTLYKLHLSKTE